MSRYILALDQGTTSSRALVIDDRGHLVSQGQVEFKQSFPRPGWVEQDPLDIWESQEKAIKIATEKIDPAQIISIGITNQRETTILWDKESMEPLYPAIVWQCRRTGPICDDLLARGLGPYIQRTTGLVVDAYFSGPKIKWILDENPHIREMAEKGRVCFGTVDSWLLYKMTGGKSHKTDFTNASRTMLFDIRKLCWDKRLLSEMDIPESLLPEVCENKSLFGHYRLDGVNIPITAMIGDQQAALFGQTCFHQGAIKNTYGTGCFLLCNTGEHPVESKKKLITTIAYVNDGVTTYALEGSVFNAGSAIQWLRDEMKIIDHAHECDQLAERVDDTGGLYFVPAFTGLGAPYWDMYATGLVVGISRGTGREHLARAVLESIAYQSMDLVKAMEEDTGLDFEAIHVDGGASASNFMMQFQADMLGLDVVRPINIQSTALGAAFLAGLGSGVWTSIDELKGLKEIDRVFKPEMTDEYRTEKYKGWKKAVERSRNWKLS